IVCQSEVWRSFAVDVLGFERSNVVVMRNWTATADLLGIGERRERRAAGAPVRLLFLGWLERDKGVFELLEACRRLAATREFIVEIAGEGNASEEARAFVTSHGLGSIVHFRGWLRGDGLHAALRDADVLVLPSWAEGLPNAMVEAMAARLAVVVSAVGAIPEIIADGFSGMLVEPRNATALTDALAQVTGDPALRERLAGESFRIAAREFALEQAADRLAEVIRATVAAGRAGRLSGHTL
ncbi:MAG TPA: glycosyltransferase family 4 protein, partial [Steroidobacteraceae bacterium]|nr:glycosyltransferase family 4 protein [Steroidobacteraceae bacterium]